MSKYTVCTINILVKHLGTTLLSVLVHFIHFLALQGILMRGQPILPLESIFNSLLQIIHSKCVPEISDVHIAQSNGNCRHLQFRRGKTRWQIWPVTSKDTARCSTTSVKFILSYTIMYRISSSKHSLLSKTLIIFLNNLNNVRPFEILI